LLRQNQTFLTRTRRVIHGLILFFSLCKSPYTYFTQIYTKDGTYVAGFGSWGPAPGQMKGIEGVALLNNNDIVVSDRENHRVQIF